MTRPFLLFLCFIALLSDISAQCPTILTDDPIEVCGSGGTKVNIEIAGTILTANWSPAIGLDDANILNPTFLAPVDTTYLLTITGLDAETKDTCELQKLIKIDVAIFDLTIAQDTVELPCGDTIRLDASVAPNGSFFIIEWETNTGNFTLGNQTLTPLIDAVGQYKANVIGTLGRIVCRDIDSLQVVLQNENLTIAPSEQLHCNRTAIDLTLLNQTNSDAYLYKWTTTNGQFIASTDDTITVVDKAGRYEVSRTDLFGECEMTAGVEVQEVVVINDFSVDLTEGHCGVAGSLSIIDIKGGQAPFQYSIDSGNTFQNTPNFKDLTAIDYTILVKDANGCALSKSISFAPFTGLDLSLINFQEVEKGTDFQLPLMIANDDTSITSIQWWPNVGLSCTDCPQPYLTEFKNRRYEVTVEDDKGCEQKAKIEIAILQPSLFYSPTVFSPNNDGQNDVFSVFINTKFVKHINQLTIFDRYGNLIFQQSAISENDLITWDGRYKGKEMSNGVYIFSGELELLDGEKERFSGTLNLVR